MFYLTKCILSLGCGFIFSGNENKNEEALKDVSVAETGILLLSSSHPFRSSGTSFVFHDANLSGDIQSTVCNKAEKQTQDAPDHRKVCWITYCHFFDIPSVRQHES